MLESLVQVLAQMLPGVLCCHDSEHRLQFFNPAYAQLYARLTGRQPQLGEPAGDWLADPDTRARVRSCQQQALAGQSVTAHYDVPTGDRIETWEVRYEPVRDAQGQVLGVLTWGQDVSTQKQQAALLRQWEVVLSQTQDAVLVTEAWPIDAEQGGPRILYVNPAFEQMTGYTQAEVIGKTPRILQGPRTQREALDRLRAALEQWQPVRVELINYRKDGQEFSVDISISPVTDAAGKVICWVAIQRDVTQEKALVARLQAALEERQVLLQEVHHRVKNNFQTVISLLELQTEYIEHPDHPFCDKLTQNLASRIQAMAYIHEQLYQQSDLSQVLLDELSASLMLHLQQVFSAASVQAGVLPGQVTLPLDLAVPVVLILHELLLNAFKHGVAAGAQHITVHSRRTAEMVTVEVIDDGQQHPPDLLLRLDRNRRFGLQFGLQIVQLLAQQLRGQVDFSVVPGRFCATLTFPLS